MSAPAITAPTEAEVSAAIEAIAREALPKTAIIPRHLLGLEDSESPNSFRSEADGNRVNALMFWRSAKLPSQDSPLKTGPAPSFDPNRLTRQGKLQVESWVYSFRFYYGSNQNGSDAVNSSATFQEMVDALDAAFAIKPKLGIDSYRIDRCSGPFWPLLGITSADDLQIHTGHGQLTVVVHYAATPA